MLADDQALVRAGFRALLDAQEGIEVVGEAADGDEAVRLARTLRPDVVLMDIRMPGVDGRKVIVGELRSLDESCKPREAERRTGGTDWSTWGWQMSYFDDAASALAWSGSMLIQGRSGERAGAWDAETKRPGWKQ